MAGLFEPIKINTMELKNRFVAAPTVVCRGTEQGYVNDAYLQYYESLARGGFGLIVVQGAFVREDGQSFEGQLGIYNERCARGLGELAYVIHRNGAKACIQLFHSGAIANPKRLDGRQPVAPSEIPCFSDPSKIARELQEEEIWETMDAFARAAVWARSAGFDGVQFHACHQSLIQQFLSPVFNKRDDKWGKDKILYSLEVIKKTREAVGKDFPIVWRCSAYESGYTLEQTCKEFVPAWEEAGVDSFAVSAGGISGIGDLASTIQPLYHNRGFLLKCAREVKKVTKLPISVAGKIMDPRLAGKIVEDGIADLVDLSRPHLADPEYPKKTLEGRTEDIRKCIGCNYCTYSIITNQIVKCAVNANSSREWAYKIQKADVSKRVVVIGGGVAGMETARVCTLRGHSVTLYEKENRLGGLVNLASAHPRLYTRDLYNIVEYLSTQLEKLSVSVHQGTEVTPEMIEDLNPDVVVVATGSRPSVPAIPGIDGSNVVTLDDYLDKKAKVGKKVAVIGGRHGAEVAVSLAREKKDVVLIESSDQIFDLVSLATVGVPDPPYMWDVMRILLLQGFFKEDGVKEMTGIEVKGITPDGVQVLGKDGKEDTIEADTVIVASGRESNRDLISSLRGKVKEIYEIGDCVKPRSIKEAIDDANYVAREI